MERGGVRGPSNIHLAQDVEIVVKSKPESRPDARLTVRAA